MIVDVKDNTIVLTESDVSLFLKQTVDDLVVSTQPTQYFIVQDLLGNSYLENL